MAKPKGVILLIDDDVDFIQINRLILEGHGYTVLAAHDAAGAMALLAGGSVDLIITDLMMQSLDSGFEFSRQVKSQERFKHIPIIIATSVGSAMGLDFLPRTPRDLSAMGVDAYLDKPLTPQRLLDTVQRLLTPPAAGTP